MWEEATSRRAELRSFLLLMISTATKTSAAGANTDKKRRRVACPAPTQGTYLGGSQAFHEFRSSIRVTIWHASEAMIPAIPNGTGVWMAVPASPPLRITIRACLDDCCDECRLPVYRCESEGGQMLRLCMSCLRLPN